ncbi:Plant-specific TFIIB-related protein [Drosera capensis]
MIVLIRVFYPPSLHFPDPPPSNEVPLLFRTSAGRCATTISGRAILEHQTLTHHHHHLRGTDSSLLLSTSDLPSLPSSDSDPFNPTGFITAYSTFSLTRNPIYAVSSVSFSGHLAELERALEGSVSNTNGGGVVVDNLRAYLQVVDVASILGLDHDISDHAFQLFRDCSSATCARDRVFGSGDKGGSGITDASANVPQKEIGKYIKILGEALQLSQPINSNSISVHMPRFCNLLQLNESAQILLSETAIFLFNCNLIALRFSLQKNCIAMTILKPDNKPITDSKTALCHLELATHIGEVVMNKCFCTRRNPISISAAAIYVACQLKDMGKTQAEICKVTVLTKVTLRKVHKELLENWDDLLPPNYSPLVPPEKAFPTTTVPSGRSSTPRGDPPLEVAALEKEKPP